MVLLKLGRIWQQFIILTSILSAAIQAMRLYIVKLYGSV